MKRNQGSNEDFYSVLTSVVTILFGLLVIWTDSFFNSKVELFQVSETAEFFFGILAITVSVIKMLGLFYHNKPMKRFGIVMIVGIWALVTALYFVNFYLFGIIFSGYILLVSLRIARRGDYIE